MNKSTFTAEPDLAAAGILRGAFEESAWLRSKFTDHENLVAKVAGQTLALAPVGCHPKRGLWKRLTGRK